ncbi:hypothetical protein T12_14392 [Trichinella patagoniensis]|uniref:Uncharacterized protein n=1 Tax=Trichinella patagoniensis TaxID=990121 RepID=A0A0V0ZLY2_9BILA|nr:hypothetical protein T12_14392 [Trichinella patagoniensis]
MPRICKICHLLNSARWWLLLRQAWGMPLSTLAQYVDAYSLERVTNGLYLHWRACFCLGCFSRGAHVTRAAPIFYIFSLFRLVEPLADLLQAFSHPQVSTSRMVMNQVQNLRDACARFHGKHRFLVRAQRFPFSGEDSISHLHPSPLGPQAFKYSAPLWCFVWPTARAQPLYHLLNHFITFSAAGLFVTKLRSSLKDETIDTLCLLRSYLMQS